MSTSGGIHFKTDQKNIKRIEKALEELDKITNENGLGVACVPLFWIEKDNTYNINAQTHWSYDGTNGRVFVEELKKIFKRKRIKIEVLEEHYA